MAYGTPHHNPERLPNKPNGWKGMYRDPKGKLRVAGYANTQAKAKKLGIDAETEVRRGDWFDEQAGKITFSEYFETQWLPHQIGEKNTLIRYRTHYNSSLKAAFGDVALRDITRPMVQRWITAELRADTVKPGTIVAKHRTLHTVLGRREGISAVLDGMLRTNPAHGVVLPKKRKRKVKVYQYDEYEAVAAQLDPWWQPLVLLCAETGMRWGELMGLHVSDFSEDFETITVTRALLELTKADTGNGTIFEEKDCTKEGDDAKVIQIAPEVAGVIRTLVRDRQLFPADRLFSMPGKDGLPRRGEFWGTGVPPSRSTFRTHHWIPAHVKAGVPRRRFHDLRGSHITWLFGGGADIATVQSRVGHAKLSTTQVYLAAMADSGDRALAALSATKLASRARAE